MSSQYVIKSWKANPEASAGSNTYVEIHGRASGLISWLLNLLNISPTVSLTVTADKIVFTEGSLEGNMTYTTALTKVSSTLNGYVKPWKEAIFLGIILGALTFFLAGIPGIIIALIYYFLNKRLAIGYTDLAGTGHLIEFKRSIIEGQNIDEKEGERVIGIIQGLVDSKHRQ
jgi:hypothetical protein